MRSRERKRRLGERLEERVRSVSWVSFVSGELALAGDTSMLALSMKVIEPVLRPRSAVNVGVGVKGQSLRAYGWPKLRRRSMSSIRKLR